MINNPHFQNFYASIFEQELISEIQNSGILKEIKEGDVLIKEGDHIKFMPLLLEGAIKIMRPDDDGDELLLYFLERGDSCAMTMNCCLGQAKSNIKAVAERDSQIIFIPVQFMSEWISKYDSWRRFVFESYNSRFQEMLGAIDTLAFLNMDDRLVKYLRDKAMVNGDTLIEATHQEIAYDLNTSRVVISRLLKKLEKEGVVKLNRNQVEIVEL